VRTLFQELPHVRHVPVTALTISAAVVCGTALALLARLKIALGAARPVRLTRARGPTAVVGAQPRLLAADAPRRPSLRLLGLRPVILFGSVSLAVSLFSLSGAPSYPRAISAILGAALGASCLATASIVLMPYARVGKDETAASSMSAPSSSPGALVAATFADILFRTPISAGPCRCWPSSASSPLSSCR